MTDIDYKDFYNWCLRKSDNIECYTYEEFLDLCSDMGSWFDEIQPLYFEYIEEGI